MIRILLIVAMLAPTTAALAQNDFAEDRLELLVSLVCENGGRMDEATAGQILPANNFTIAEVREIVFELEDRGLVTDVGTGTLVLGPGACNG